MRRSVLLLMVLALPGTAAGADGIVVDPGSPAGKEYAIPLDSARVQGSPETVIRSARPAPAFGVGIEASAPQSPAAVDGSRSGPGASVRRDQPRSRRSTKTSRTRAADARAPAAIVATPSATAAEPLLWSGLGAVVVLLLGLGAGLAIRKSQR